MRPTENKVNTASPNVVSSRTFELSDMLENLSASQLQVLTQTPELLVLKLMSISSISYNQLLNVIADNVAAQTALTSSPEHHQQSGEQLQSLAVLLERTHVTINEHYNLINQGSDQATAAGNGPYPVNLSQAVNHELVRTRSSVQGGLEHLMRRCLQIQGEARTTSDALMRAGQLLQTQGSEEQTREINNLTRVAFVFLPLSFVASIFGMNVAQLAGNPPIWIFFATAVPCTLATFMIAKWDSIMSWLMRRWENRGKN
jgi:Mg2+ and Co2+ transporter CorA